MYSDSAHLLFWRDGLLWAVRFDPVWLEISGDSVVIRGLGAVWVRKG